VGGGPPRAWRPRAGPGRAAPGDLDATPHQSAFKGTVHHAPRRGLHLDQRAAAQGASTSTRRCAGGQSRRVPPVTGVISVIIARTRKALLGIEATLAPESYHHQRWPPRRRARPHRPLRLHYARHAGARRSPSSTGQYMKLTDGMFIRCARRCTTPILRDSLPGDEQSDAGCMDWCRIPRASIAPARKPLRRTAERFWRGAGGRVGVVPGAKYGISARSPRRWTLGAGHRQPEPSPSARAG